MLKNRPVVIFCLAFVSGILAGLFLSLWQALLLLLGIYCIALTVESFIKLPGYVFVAIAILAAGIGCSMYNANVTRGYNVFPSATYTVEGYVKDIKNTANGYNIKIEGVGGDFDGYGFQLYTSDNELQTGYLIRFNCNLSKAKSYIKGNGIDFVIRNYKLVSYGDKASGLTPLLLRLREHIGDYISNIIGNDDTAGFYTALFTGDSSMLSHEMNSSFSRSGISHILVVSGQHFSLLIINLYSLLMLTVRRKKLCSAISLVLCVLFAIFTGASPSILRAAFMCGVYLLFKIAMVESDALNTLSLSLVFILLISPYSILSVSLQLSFLSTLGLVFTSQYLNKKSLSIKHNRKIIMFFVTPLVLSFVCTLFCMPIFLTTFDGISAFAPLTNFLINIFIIPLFLLGIPGIILCGITDFSFLVYALNFGVDIIRSASDFVASFKFAYISTSVPYIRWALLPSLAAILICPFVKLKQTVVVLSSSIVGMLIVLFGCVYSYKVSLSRSSLLFLNDGKSSSYALLADGNETVYLDICGRANACPDIFDCGFTYLDKYVILECTDDAYTRLQRTATYITVEEIYLPYGDIFSYRRDDFIDYANEHGIKIYEYANGERLVLNSCEIITADAPKAKSCVMLCQKSENSIALYGLDVDTASNGTYADTVIVSSNYFPVHSEAEKLYYTADKLYIHEDNAPSGFYDVFDGLDYSVYEESLLLRFNGSEVKEVIRE